MYNLLISIKPYKTVAKGLDNDAARTQKTPARLLRSRRPQHGGIPRPGRYPSRRLLLHEGPRLPHHGAQQAQLRSVQHQKRDGCGRQAFRRGLHLEIRRTVHDIGSRSATHPKAGRQPDRNAFGRQVAVIHDFERVPGKEHERRNDRYDASLPDDRFPRYDAGMAGPTQKHRRLHPRTLYGGDYARTACPDVRKLRKPFRADIHEND